MDSTNSSPRSRSSDFLPSSDDPSSRLRLMCSHGGRIVPRPSDKSLCYVGGDTRMVVVPRHLSLRDLSQKLSLTFSSPLPFSLKYQLPNEDLDSLISLASDEDLDNMIDEYDRLSTSSKPSRIRLFVFPPKTDSAANSSIGSLLDDSKSETWFEDALNSVLAGIPRGNSADSGTVGCLLGLEDEPRNEVKGKVGRQDVQSVPDSPMLDNSSSFGSASSAPSLSNLPPIRVRAEERERVVIEEQMGRMNISSGGGGSRADQQNSQQVNLVQKSAQNDSLIADSGSRANYVNLNSDLKRESPVSSDPGYAVPVQAAGGGYVWPTSQPEQFQQQQQQQPLTHLHQQVPQQQYIQANAHYIQHPISTYFHPMQQSQQAFRPYDPQLPMYFIPVGAPTSYAVPAANLADPNSLQAAGKPAVPAARVAVNPELQQANIYRTSAPAQAPQAVLQPQLIRVATTADQAHNFGGMGYHLMPQQQPHLAQAPAAVTNFGYEYTADPAHAQVYYSQATSPPALAATQYQAVNSGAGAVSADVTTAGDVKAART